VLPGSQRPLAVGGAAFQAAWFFETLGGRGYYSRIEREVLDWDLDGWPNRSCCQRFDDSVSTQSAGA
jgi:hypothetical protein